MRRLLLLAALSVAVILALVPAAGAQGNDISCPEGSAANAAGTQCTDLATGQEVEPISQTLVNPETPQTNPCPEGIALNPDGTCDVGNSGSPAPTAMQYETPTDTQAVSCDQFISAAGNPSQFQAQQFYDFQATPEQQAALDADGDGFACDDLETGVDNLGVTDADRGANTEAPATSTATSTALPATGGISLVLLAAVLLLGSSILGLAIARRNS